MRHPPTAAAPGTPGRGPALALILLAAAALVIGSGIGYFRAEDWLGLEIGARAFSHWRDILLTMWHDNFYRPVTDFYVGVMVHLSPREPRPHFLALIALFAIETLLLARIARLRGADPAATWVVAAAPWAQVNVYVWSTLWMSNAGGSLTTLLMLATLWLHHRAVARARLSAGGTAATLAATALALLSKEDAVMLPAILIALEAPRWSRLSAEARRVAWRSAAAIGIVVAAYVAFRLVVMTTPQVPGQHYHMHFGPNWVRNLAFFALHLGALPVVALALSRLFAPRAWTAAARSGEDWAHARAEMIAGLAWAAVAIQIFLPIGGHAYGYLHGPGFGIALATGSGLAWAWGAHARLGPATGRPATLGPVAALATHWALALVAVAWAFNQAGWPRYRALARDAFAVLDRAMPAPPESARVVFLDPDRREAITGRSLFSMMFDGLPGSVLRVHYGRDDLRGDYVRGPAAWDTVSPRPDADLVVFARDGRLRVVQAGPRLARTRGEAGP